MPDTQKRQLAESCRFLLRPLTRVLLRHGMSYGEFAEIVKTAYVESARADLAVNGKRPSDARVAVITGLTRKDVKRLREQIEADEAPHLGNANRATRVLSGWYQDPEFADQNGQPRLLESTGPDGFIALAARYSGDMPPGTVLDELLRVGAVKRTEDGLLQLINRNYMPTHGDPEALRIFGTASTDLLTTLDHNLNPNRDEAVLLQRSVFSARLPEKSVAVFKRIAADHSARLIEILDEWLSNYEADSDSNNRNLHRTGVGLYLFDSPIDGAQHERGSNAERNVSDE